MKVRIKDREWFIKQGHDVDSWVSDCHESFGQVYEVGGSDEEGYIDVNDICWSPDEYDVLDEVDDITEETIPVDDGVDLTQVSTTEYSDKHYNFSYQLSEEEIEKGEIRLDPYKICKVWGLNEKDNTGGLFHLLKTISRYGDKNPKERELKAIKATATRMEELLK